MDVLGFAFSFFLFILFVLGLPVLLIVLVARVLKKPLMRAAARDVKAFKAMETRVRCGTGVIVQ